LLESGDINATVEKTIEISDKNMVIYISNSFQVIEVLPDDAKKILVETERTVTVNDIVLKEVNKSAEYVIDAEKEVKLLWFIPMKMRIKAHINASNGQLKQIEKPWWNFLTSSD